MAHDVLVSEPTPTGKTNARMKQTVGDMVRSMAVVLAVVAAILLVTWRPQPDPVREVNVDQLLVVAVAQADFDVVVPDTPGLRPTSVRWQPTAESKDEMVWQVGYVTETDEFLQVTQSRSDSSKFLSVETVRGVPLGSVAINSLVGDEWTEYQSETSTAFVSMSNGTTTIVRGTGPREEIISGVESLVPGASLQ